VKTQREIAEQFGIHQVHVSHIVLRKVWGHVV
jgi:predicted XRE-type DNA-binding protein